MCATQEPCMIRSQNSVSPDIYIFPIIALSSAEMEVHEPVETTARCVEKYTVSRAHHRRTRPATNKPFGARIEFSGAEQTRIRIEDVSNNRARVVREVKFNGVLFDFFFFLTGPCRSPPCPVLLQPFLLLYYFGSCLPFTERANTVSRTTMLS